MPLYQKVKILPCHETEPHRNYGISAHIFPHVSHITQAGMGCVHAHILLALSEYLKMIMVSLAAFPFPTSRRSQELISTAGLIATSPVNQAKN